jgi:ABC-type transport system involved in multi-copper enzyme maturation permease subunit
VSVAAGGELGAVPVSLRTVTRSEWVKFTTLRSTIAVLTAAMVGMLVVGALVGYNTRHLSSSLDANDIVASSPLQGYYLGQLLIGALGVLYVTTEFSTGMIRATMVAVPRRLPVLWGKLLVFTVWVAITMVAMSLLAFLLGEAIIGHYRTGFSLASPGALRVAVGTGIYLTLIGIIGSALGWIVRSTPGALVSYLAVILVIPVLFGNVLGHWGKNIAEYLPSSAGAAFINTIPDQPSVAPWTGLGVMALWTVLFLVVAAVRLARSDV